MKCKFDRLLMDETKTLAWIRKQSHFTWFRHSLGDCFMNSIIVLILEAQFGSHEENFFRLKSPILRSRRTALGVGAPRQKISPGCYPKGVAHSWWYPEGYGFLLLTSTAHICFYLPMATCLPQGELPGWEEVMQWQQYWHNQSRSHRIDVAPPWRKVNF